MRYVLSILVCVIACSFQPQADERPKDLVEKLRSPRADEREVATAALKKLGPAALSELAAAAKDPDREVAERAELLIRVIRVSGQLSIALKCALPGIEDGLAGPADAAWTNAFLNASGIRGLSLAYPRLSRHDFEPLVERAIRGAFMPRDRQIICKTVQERRIRCNEIIVPLLNDPDLETSRCAADALLRVATPEDVPRLLEILREGRDEAKVGCLDVLSKLGYRGIVPDCLALMRARSFAIGQAAVRSLVMLNARDKEKELLALLLDPEISVRVRAIAVLRQLRIPSSVDRLAVLLKAEESELRSEATNALADFREPRLRENYFELLGDPHPRVRGAAIRALSLVYLPGDESRIEVLLQDTIANARIKALQALATVQARGAIPSMIRLIQDRNTEVREYALLSLADLGWEGTRAQGKTSLKSEDESMRCTGLECLAIAGNKEDGDLVASALGDPSRMVRKSALMAVVALKEVAAVPDCERLLLDSDVSIRLLAVEALGGLGVVASIPKIVDRLSDAEYPVRIAAATSLCKLKSNAGVRLLLEQGESLSILNLLTAPEVVKRLEMLKPPPAASGTVREAFETLASQLNCSLEVPTPPQEAQWLDMPLLPAIHAERSFLHAANRLLRDNHGMILSKDRVRILSRTDLENAWEKLLLGD